MKSTVKNASRRYAPQAPLWQMAPAQYRCHPHPHPHPKEGVLK